MYNLRQELSTKILTITNRILIIYLICYLVEDFYSSARWDLAD